MKNRRVELQSTLSRAYSSVKQKNKNLRALASIAGNRRSLRTDEDQSEPKILKREENIMSFIWYNMIRFNQECSQEVKTERSDLDKLPLFQRVKYYRQKNEDFYIGVK